MNNAKRDLGMYLNTLSLITLGLNLLLQVGCDNPLKKQDIIAKVGNESLSINDVLTDTPPQIRSNLNAYNIKEYTLRWINNEVLYQEALNRKLDEKAEFQNELKKIKKELLISRLVEQVLNNKISVTDKEIENYFNNNGDEFVLTDDIVHAYHIRLDTKREADAIRKRLNNGEKFENCAKEIYSDSLNSSNWDLGYFTKREIIPEISKFLFNSPVGAHSYPIKSELGYHILKLVDKQKAGEIKKLKLVKEEIRFKLEEQKKQEYYQRFLLRTKSNFKIKTNFQLLNESVLDSLNRKGE